MSDLELQHYDTEQARGIFDALVEVYLEVYADDDDEFFGEDRYRRQLDSHMAGPGFELVSARLDGELVGYVYGYTLPAAARWWRGLLTEVAPDVVTETGSRTFALCEVMVRSAWRGTGAGHALHDELLRGRAEERATLLVEPENPARDIYLHWGWEKVGQVRPSWEGAPTYDALILPLSRGSET
jgi:ribosomal protein S18 acetylase RimI-like enzyme